MEYITLVPAYGRDYKSGKEAKADWLAGKDFVIANAFHRYNGQPMSVRGATPDMTFNIRYKQRTGGVVVKGTEKAV